MQTACDVNREWRYRTEDRCLFWLLIGVHTASFGFLWMVSSESRGTYLAAAAVLLGMLSTGLTRQASTLLELRTDRLVVRPGKNGRVVFFYKDVRRVSSGWQRTTLHLADGQVKKISHWRFRDSADGEHFRRELAARVEAAADGESREEAKETNGSFQ